MYFKYELQTKMLKRQSNETKFKPPLKTYGQFSVKKYNWWNQIMALKQGIESVI